MAVKSAKRIIYDNAKSNGDINTDAAAKATLQYRNTPLQDCSLSPAQLLFHRQLRDVLPNRHKLHPEWTIAANEREREYTKKNRAIAKEYNRHTKSLSPLMPGTLVFVQGRDKRWRKQGKIIESLDHRQYRIRLLGSGRVTLRNRHFIRECTQISPAIPLINTSMNDTEDIPTEGAPTHEPTSPTIQQPVLRDRFVTPEQALPATPNLPRNIPKRTPRALKNLRTYNKPGLKELFD